MPDRKTEKPSATAEAASRRQAVAQRQAIQRHAGSRNQRACLAGQRDRPADRSRRLPSGHDPAERGEMVGNLRRQPLGGARGDQDADGQEPAQFPPQDRQLGRAQGAMEPARSRRAELVRDIARSRRVPAHRAGVPLHHRAGSDGIRGAAPDRRADGRNQQGVPRNGAGDVADRSERAPTPAFMSPSCGPRATNCWCRSACSSNRRSTIFSCS